MVKVSYTLSSHQQFILYTISQAGWMHLEYRALKRTIESIDAQDDFNTFLKICLGIDPDGFRLSTQPKPKTEFESDFEGLEFLGLVTNYGRIELTEEGKRVAKSIKENRRLLLRPRKELQSTIFIACAFGNDEIDQLYSDHLSAAAESLNYEPVRIDMKEPKQTITEAITQNILECACLIADLTHARPSVYFEVGFAHGLGIPLLLTCRRDHHRGEKDNSKVHFDLEQYKISYWSRTPKGYFRWGKGMGPSDRLAAIVSRKEK